MTDIKNKKIKTIIIGAGPAGLSAGLEILRNGGASNEILIVEKTAQIGGISKTAEFKGNRIDIGGHRFFSKSDKVMDWWAEILPMKKVGVDPEKTDKVMLVRNRLSRIFFLKKFFQYPVTLSVETIKNLGFVRMWKIGWSYGKSLIFKIKPEKNLEDFFINRFGRELYLTFFKDYTEKVWGVKCDEIPADWGEQRIKGLSIISALKNIFSSKFYKNSDINQKNKETSLIEKFLYPKFGPGQMWQEAVKKIEGLGGKILMETCVEKIHINQISNKIVAVTVEHAGKSEKIDCDYLISSMPVKELIEDFDGKVPEEVLSVAGGLKYRDFLTVGVLLRKMSPQIAENGIAPDNWIYIQEPYVKVGRIQIFNNWSPYMVKDKNTVWLGMEYFCDKGDEFWQKSDEEIKKLAMSELSELCMALLEDILDSTVLRMEKAYPAYFGTFKKFETIKNFTDKIENLFLVGRNGMHRYNNQDHSMLTGMEAAGQIISGIIDKSKIWSVNTEKDYHEKK